MNISSAPEQASAVLAAYTEKVRGMQCQLAVLRMRQRRTLAAVIAGVILCAALLIVGIHGPKAIHVAMAVALIGTIWASQDFLGSRKSSVELARRSGFYERGIERLEDDWRGKGSTGWDYARDKHLYQADLEILGEGSLFELLCTTRSSVGAERLAVFLLDPPPIDEARARQEAVKELRNTTALREEIALLGKYQFQNCEGRHLREWLDLPMLKVHPIVSVFLFFSSAISLILGICGFATILTWIQIAPLLIPWLLAQAGISLALMRGVHLHLKMLSRLADDVLVLRQGVGLMERQDFRCAKLRNLIARTRSQDAAATIQKLERLVRAIEKRGDPILGGFSLWLAIGTQLMLGVERWRAVHQREFEEWLNDWAEFEALNAMACYAFEHPDNTFPQLLDGGARFEGKGLCHPLLPPNRGVGNDVALNDSTAFYVISGSNMAGKSTFLRAIGLNAILAAAGAPVRAVKARMSVFNVCASIAIADSLLEGKSKFLAEVERLRESISVTEEERPVLFLIDEILSGTNSRDRRIAAESVIVALVAGGAVGALSTHDLALTEIAVNEELHGMNLHMQSENPDEPLTFDYLVKPGILRQTNALAIMKMVGISID
jgi:hypothetical protein